MLRVQKDAALDVRVTGVEAKSDQKDAALDARISSLEAKSDKVRLLLLHFRFGTIVLSLHLFVCVFLSLFSKTQTSMIVLPRWKQRVTRFISFFLLFLL